jgi:translation initiation factor 3 subunit M
MPGPSNTLLIEGSFSELADELAQYVDMVSKSEANAGVQSDIARSLGEIREKEQSEEPVDAVSIQKQKDEVLKKIVGNAVVLNSAPEKGQLVVGNRKGNADALCRIYCCLQPSYTPFKSVACS